MRLSDYVAEHKDSRSLLDRLQQVIEEVGSVEVRESASQIAFRRRRTFALAWAPGQYLGERGAPLVLSVVLPERDDDPRWKEVVEPSRGGPR